MLFKQTLFDIGCFILTLLLFHWLVDTQELLVVGNNLIGAVREHIFSLILVRYGVV